MLVDDEPNIRKVMQIILRRQGIDVLEAADGKECIDTIKDDIRIIIIDRTMPIMNGEQTIRHLRLQGYTGTIIALTGNTIKEVIQSLQAAGADMVLAKPADRSTILAAIASTHTAPDIKEMTNSPIIYSRRLGGTRAVATVDKGDVHIEMT